MKKLYFPLLVAMIVVTSCQSKPTPVSFDPVTAKAEITKALDDINEALNSRDTKAFLSFFTEDGLYCGTDPKEVWDKAAFAKTITEMLADKTYKPNTKVDNREIRFDKDGNSANVIEQFNTSWSKPVQVRNTMHFVKANNKWLIDFSSLALIPENKDLPKITKVLKK